MKYYTELYNASGGHNVIVMIRLSDLSVLMDNSKLPSIILDQLSAAIAKQIQEQSSNPS